MGFDRRRFKESDLKEQYFCSICSDVFKDPVQRVKCEHYFCRECITQWLQTSKSCPIDKQPLTSRGLKDAPRFMRDTLANLDIGCDFASVGCQTVVKLERLEDHVEDCLFSPEVIVNCVKECGASFKRKDEGAHCCLSHLIAVVNQLEEEKKKGQEQAKVKEQKLKDKNQALNVEIKALNEKEKQSQRLIKMLRQNVKMLEDQVEGIDVSSLGQSSAQKQKTNAVLDTVSSSCSSLPIPEIHYDPRVVHTSSRPLFKFFGVHRCSVKSLVISYNGFKLFHVSPGSRLSFPRHIRFNITIPFMDMTRVVVMFRGTVSIIRVQISDETKGKIKTSLGLNETQPSTNESVHNVSATLSSNDIVMEMTDLKEEAKLFIRLLLNTRPSLDFAEISLPELKKTS